MDFWNFYGIFFFWCTRIFLSEQPLEKTRPTRSRVAISDWPGRHFSRPSFGAGISLMSGFIGHSNIRLGDYADAGRDIYGRSSFTSICNTYVTALGGYIRVDLFPKPFDGSDGWQDRLLRFSGYFSRPFPRHMAFFDLLISSRNWTAPE